MAVKVPPVLPTVAFPSSFIEPRPTIPKCQIIVNVIQRLIQRRILAGNRTQFAAISLFRKRFLSKATKILLYKTLIRPTVAYDAETWSMTKEEQALFIFERKIFRRIYGPKCEDENRPRRPRERGEVQPYSFFNLGARWGWVLNATPRPLHPREIPGTHCIGSRVGRKIWVRKISPPTGIRYPDRKARKDSLYRLSYRGPPFQTKCSSKW